MIQGVGWPNGPVDNNKILELPGPLLILSSEHWHVRQAQNTRRVVYRILPPLDKRPAVIGWDVDEYINMVIDQMRGLSITDLIPWNELDLNYERGDREDDFQNLPQRYQIIGDFGFKVIRTLKALMPNVKIHWPAFTPNKDHAAIDYIHLWKNAALMSDVIDFHAYDTLDNIKQEHKLYAREFPYNTLELTEWHCRGNIEEERKVVSYLNEQNLQGFFFIYRWDNPSDWWSTTYDIEHNIERYNMFMEQEQENNMPTNNVDAYQSYAKSGCIQRNIHYPTYKLQIETESNWNHYRPDGSIVTSPTGSKGLGQLNSRFYGPELWTDPFVNLDTSMDIMRDYLDRFGSYRKALAAYNWGPANVSGYRDSQGNTHPAWDGTKEWRCPVGLSQCSTAQRDHYLTRILGPEWNEPVTSTETETETEESNMSYVVGTGIMEKMQEDGTEPATDELYFKNNNNTDAYSYAFGKNGTQYVYLFDTNETHRFRPD